MLKRRLIGLLAITGTVAVIGIAGAPAASADVYRVPCIENTSDAVGLGRNGQPEQCFDWNGHGSHYLPVNDYYDVVCADYRDGAIVWWTNGDKGPVLRAGYCDYPDYHGHSKVAEVYVP